MKKLNEVEKEYKQELKEIYGIENSRNQILDYIKNIAINKKEGYINSNIIITNSSSYPNQTKDKLIDLIYKVLLKNKIIKCGIEYISEKTIKEYIKNNSDFEKDEKEKNKKKKELVIKNDLVVINNNNDFRNLVSWASEICDLIKMYPYKVFIIIEENDKYSRENIKSTLCNYIGWFFEIDKISETNKKEYITKCLDEKKIIIDKESLHELSEEPFYMVKNITNRIILNSKEKCNLEVTKKDINIYLEKTNKNSSQNNKKIFENNSRINELVGMENVKKEINKIINYLKLCRKRNSEIPMLHMCFTGNPGTGKTTVARIIGEMLKEERILSCGDFVEVHARDLIGRYVGWTANTVREQIKKAKGGVLFIDEAYSLNVDRQGSFEDEAIATLIKEMEDNRDDLCVIFAGYEEETMDLIKRNPGFESRIQFYIDFEDYQNEDLYEIFKSLSKKEKYRIATNVKENLVNIFGKYKKEDNFSNARFVRNLFEKVKIEQANRVVGNEKNFEVIKKCDIENVLEQMELKKCKLATGEGYKIGFRV